VTIIGQVRSLFAQELQTSSRARYCRPGGAARFRHARSRLGATSALYDAARGMPIFIMSGATVSRQISALPHWNPSEEQMITALLIQTAAAILGALLGLAIVILLMLGGSTAVAILYGFTLNTSASPYQRSC